jgi:hypothetical protein
MDFLVNGVGVIKLIIIFLLLHLIAKTVYNKSKCYFHKRVHPEHYLPQEEIHNQRQIFYMVMVFACLIFFVYMLEISGVFYLVFSPIFGEEADLINVFFGQHSNGILFDSLEILLSIYLSLQLDIKNSRKDLLIFLLLVPYWSLDAAFYELNLFSDILINDLILMLSLIFLHSLSYLYFIRVYYKKFKKYTRNNSLGRTILLFFVLLLITTIITIITENVELLDAINMVSNAFASNGYLVLGTSAIGKLNEIIIVWGGYLLSGIATATLTATILIRYYDVKIKEIHEENNRNLDELEEIIKSRDSK